MSGKPKDQSTDATKSTGLGTFGPFGPFGRPKETNTFLFDHKSPSLFFGASSQSTFTGFGGKGFSCIINFYCEILE